MINQRSFSKKFLVKASLGATPLEKSAQLSIRIPNFSTNQTSLSRTSLSTTKNTKINRTSYYGDADTVNLESTDRSNYPRRLSPLNTRIETQSVIKTERLRTDFSNTGNLSSKTLRFSDKYVTLTTESGYESVRNDPLSRVVKILERFLHKEDLTSVQLDGVRKTGSIKPAKRTIAFLIESLKELRFPKTKHLLGSPVHRTREDENHEQRTMLTELNDLTSELLVLCDKVLYSRKSKSKLDSLLKEMCEIAQRNDNGELSLYCFLVQGKVYMARNDFLEAINHFRYFKDLCISYNLAGNALKAYKFLGKCHQELKKYKPALRYYTRFLQVAWYVNSEKHELLAYDYIGLQYYYLGELEKAGYYHSRMMGGKLEQDNSNLKRIGINKVRMDLEKEVQTRRNRKDVRAQRTKNWKDLNEQEEGSSREDDYELPIPAAGQQEDKDGEKGNQKNEGGQEYPKSEYQARNIIRKKKSQNGVMVGVIKAKIAQMAKDQAKEKVRERQRLLNGLDNVKDMFGFYTTDKTKSLVTDIKITPSLPGNLKAKPNEAIFVSHLSRNRQLKNFAGLIHQNAPLQALEEPVDWNDALDIKATEKVRRIMEKFKVNLTVLQQVIKSIS